MNTINDTQQYVDDPGLLLEERGFYATPELSQRLDLLRHLIDSSDLVPLMLGDSGAGKSTLINQLQLKTEDSWLVCRIDANPMLHPEQLMVQLARFFGVSETDDNIYDRLIRCFGSIHSEGRLVVIIVDDADQLSVASLIVLLRLLEWRPDSMPIVALALFALPDIKNTISAPQLDASKNFQQRFHLMEMPTITREQTPGYIKHLLAQEELPDQYFVIKPALDTLFRMSEGLPGKLTMLTLRSINNSNNNVSAYTIKKRFSYRKIAAIGGGVLIVALLLFQDQVNRLFNPEVVTVQQPLALPDQEMSDLKEQTKPETPPLLIAVEPPEVEELQRVARQEQPRQPLEAERQSELPANNVVAVTPKEEPIVIETRQMDSQNSVVPVEQKKNLPISPLPVLKEISEEPVVTVDTAHEPEPRVASVPVKSVAAPQQKELEGTQWVLTQPATGFTLQLIGLSELKSLHKYIRQHGLQGRVSYIKSLRKGRPWFVLLSGSYTDRDQAKSAISRDLPQSLQKSGIWARSFESLKQELQK